MFKLTAGPLPAWTAYNDLAPTILCRWQRTNWTSTLTSRHINKTEVKL